MGVSCQFRHEVVVGRQRSEAQQIVELLTVVVKMVIFSHCAITISVLTLQS